MSALMNQRFGPSLPRPGIFVMRDGVICQREADSTPASGCLELVPGALEGLRLLAHLDAPIIVLGRQIPDVAMDGMDGMDASRALTRSPASPESYRRLRTTLRAHGARVDGIRSYPVAPHDGVHCERKALARLLQRAARLYTVELTASVLIGDTWTHAQAAAEHGCQPLLVMTGLGREQIALPQLAALRTRTWYAADLAAAALSVDAYLDRSRQTQTVA